MKLADHLGALPSGRIVSMEMDAVGRHLGAIITSETERKRVKLAQARLDLYRDETAKTIEAAVDKLFKNAAVKDWRKELVEFSLFQNLTRRIVNDTATVYSEPATRAIANGVETYREFIRVVGADAKMEAVNRYLNLLNDVLIVFRVRADGKPTIAVVTPDRFWPVSHPLDPTWPVAYVIEQAPRGGVVVESDPHYLVLAEEETFQLTRTLRVIPDSRQAHSLGRIPAILAQREPRDDQILNPTLGEDLTSAHKAIALLNVLMLKNQKSGTRQAFATGDTSAMARDQPMDEEAVLEVPEGVRLDTLDMGADPSSYINTVRAVLKQIAANYGISETMFDLSYQATSGFEIKLKRIGLHEIRLRQIKTFRPLERDLAELQSLILRSVQHPLAFDVAGWSIDFGAVDEPGNTSELSAWWDWLEAKGLINRVEMYMTLNPEATEAEALQIIAANEATHGPTETSLAETINALGVLIRAGYRPDAAAAAVGLPAIAHTGLPPVTLKVDE